MKICGPSSQKKYQNKNKNVPTYSSRSKGKKRDYVNVINSLFSRVLWPAQTDSRFNILKKSQFLCFAVVVVSRQNFSVLSMSLRLLLLYLLDHSNGKRSGDEEAAKPALAFENVDFVDDVVIFVIVVRINETRKVLRKVCPRYYINK